MVVTTTIYVNTTMIMTMIGTTTMIMVLSKTMTMTKNMTINMTKLFNNMTSSKRQFLLLAQNNKSLRKFNLHFFFKKIRCFFHYSAN